MWIGTYDGLNLYDDEIESFRRFLQSPTRENSISQNTILCLLEDRDNHLWVGTYYGLNRIDLRTFHITTFLANADGTGLADNAVSALLMDRNGKIWACTGKGINIIGSGGVEEIIPQSNLPGGLPSDVIISVIQDSTKVIFFGTNGSGVLRLENEMDRSFDQYTKRSAKPALGSDLVSEISIDRKGTILIGTDGAGLYRYNNNGTFVQVQVPESSVINNSNVEEIFVDEQNNYWLGIYGVGLIFVPGYHQRFKHFQFFDQAMEMSQKNSVLAIVEDHDKKIWIGTDGSGLYKYDPETEVFTSHVHVSTNRNSLSTNVVKSLLVDDKNNLYIGTYGGGLNYLNTRTNTFRRYLHVPGNPTSISTNHVWSLLQDSRGRVYVGQLGGLDEFLPEKQEFTPLKITGGNPVTNFTASIFSMKEDNQGNIWMGTRLAGIHQYSPETRTFRSLLYNVADSLSFPSNEILTLQVAGDGKILIGTDNKGLFELNPKTSRSVRIIPDFKSRSIPSVLEDETNNVWFTSFDGLHRYNRSTKETARYAVADGLQGIQFNEGAALRASNGNFYFGGTNGLNIFDPNQMNEDTSTLKVVFTKLNLFHDNVKVGDKSTLLAKSITKTKNITFSPQQNVFSIEFACLEYKFPKRNRYRYYLEGFDKSWNYVNEIRAATYTNLPPGKYTLMVSAANANGYWSDRPSNLEITVMPLWHQRLEVRLGFAILVVVLILAVIHVRTRFLFRQKKRLEHLVKLRTELVETKSQEINDKNQRLEQAYGEVNTVNDQLQKLNANLEGQVEKRTLELQHTLARLIETDKGLDTFLYRSSHDLRGPIVSIIGLARLGRTELSRKFLQSYFEKIETTGSGMLRLLSRLTDTASLFRWNRSIQIIEVATFVQSIKTVFEKLNVNHHVKMQGVFVDDDCHIFSSDPDLLNLVLLNVLDNSIVFRRECDAFVKVVLRSEGQRFVIQVIDNGIGIDSNARHRIFDMFYRGSERSIGNGLGLFIVRKALEILEGSIEIESNPETLAMVTIRIPTGQFKKMS